MTSPLSGWLAHQVTCNNLLIASFMTSEQAVKFAADRKQRWPQNKYEVFPLPR